MIKSKKPLYLNWWLWVGIFLITAVIVNLTKPAPDSAIHFQTNEINDDDLNACETTFLTMAPANQREVTENFGDDHPKPTFLIGTQLPAGEYFAIAANDQLGYLLLTRSRKLIVSEIIGQKYFENHTIINLRDGEYLTTKNVTLIPIDDAIVPGFSEGLLEAGTYRVGIDIPPGVYTLFPLEDKIGYFATATTSYQLNAHTTQHQNFSEPITIALNPGDYFLLMRAIIKK